MSANFRYFLPLRPVSLGTQPNGFIDYKNFEKRQFCPEIDHDAWGWVEYDHPLTVEQMKEYDLLQMPTGNRFKAFRERYGTREEFAKLTGQKVRLFEGYEQGIRDPKGMSVNVFKQIAEALGMTMEELYDQF